MDQEIDEYPTKSFWVGLVLLNSVTDEAIDPAVRRCKTNTRDSIR